MPHSNSLTERIDALTDYEALALQQLTCAHSRSRDVVVQDRVIGAIEALIGQVSADEYHDLQQLVMDRLERDAKRFLARMQINVDGGVEVFHPRQRV